MSLLPMCFVAVSFSANVSNILFDQRSQIEETMMNSSTISTASYCPVNKPSTPSKMPPPAAKKTPMKTPVKTTSQTIIAPGKLKHLLHELDVSQTKKAGAFLDGCGVIPFCLIQFHFCPEMSSSYLLLFLFLGLFSGLDY